MGLQNFLAFSSAFLQWRLYLLLNVIFSFFRNLIWRLTGTYGKLQSSYKSENFERSAHVMKMLFYHSIDELVEMLPTDYLLLHDRFESPEFVLRDDVLFVTVTDEVAMFVQKKEGSAPFESFPFVVMAVHDSPHRIITMPLSSFHKLVETKLPPIDGKLVFLHNTARCGGTMFTEIFKACGNCLTSCESHVLNAISKYYYTQGTWDRETTKHMLKNAIHMLCKPRTDLPEKPCSYVVKPTCFAIICAELIHDVYPEAAQLFIYRDPVVCALSVRRLCTALPSIGLMTALPNFPRSAAFWARLHGYCDVDFRDWSPKTHLELSWGFRISATTQNRYLRFREQGIPMTGIRYEIMLDHQKVITKKMFKLCGIPLDRVDVALDAVGKDSQAGSPVSQAILKKLNPNPPIATPQFMAEMQAMCDELKIPALEQWSDHGFALPGSLTP